MKLSTATSPPDSLRLAGVSKRYGSTTVLRDANLGLQPGRVHAVIGENGAGKSTLLMIAAGLIQPDEGEVQTPGGSTHQRGLRPGVALVSQELSSVPGMTVLENVTLGLPESRLGSLRRGSARRVFETACSTVGVNLPADRRARDLSLADQQWLEVLRAVARRPRVLLLDEPTAALDADGSARLLALLRSLSDQGMAILLVSHFLGEVREVADDVTVLRDGSVVRSGPAGSETEDELVQLMVGRSLSTLYPEKAEVPESAPVIFEANGIHDGLVVHDVSLRVRRGEIVGLAGLVGSGRSEFAQCAFGARRVRSGQVTLGGASARAPRSVRSTMRAGLALIPEDRKGQGLVLGRSIQENLILASLGRVSSFGFVRRRRVTDLASRWLGATDVRARSALSRIGDLSGGNQQKVLIAKWLLREPLLLIADEPTRGVDVAAKVAIHRLLVQAAAEGRGVVLISSELDELLGLAHRILVFRQGTVVAELTGSAMTPGRVMSAAFGAGTRAGDEGMS